MTLKTYYQFIKESYDDLSNFEKEWSLDNEDIKFLFLDMIDEGAILDITKYTMMYYTVYWANEKRYLHYSDAIKTLNTPGYVINISFDKINDIVKENLTFAVKTLRDMIDCEIQIDYDSKTTVEVKDGFESDHYSLYDNCQIDILVIENKDFEISEKHLAEIYEWEYDYIEKDNIYFDISQEDLADLILDNDSYSDIVKNGMESMWDLYLGYDYYDKSDFEYNITDENKKLLIKAIIKKEFKGWDNFKEEDIVTYIDKEFNTEEEFVKYCFNDDSVLNELCDDSDIFMNVIRNKISDWNSDAKAMEDYKTIMDNFEDKVSNIFNDYEKIKKTEKVYYTSNEKKLSYDNEVTYYRIGFDDEWMTELLVNGSEAEDLKYFDGVQQLMEEYFHATHNREELNPHLNYNYGDVDYEALNNEIKSELIYELK